MNIRMLGLSLALLTATLATPVHAATADACAGGADAPFPAPAVPLSPPVTCDGNLGGTGEVDLDAYSVAVPVGSTFANVTAQLCATVNDTFGSIRLAVSYLSDSPLGGGGPSESRGGIHDGECWTIGLGVSVQDAVFGGTWSIRVLPDTATSGTTYAYTLSVS